MKRNKSDKWNDETNSCQYENSTWCKLPKGKHCKLCMRIHDKGKYYKACEVTAL